MTGALKRNGEETQTFTCACGITPCEDRGRGLGNVSTSCRLLRATGTEREAWSRASCRKGLDPGETLILDFNPPEL